MKTKKQCKHEFEEFRSLGFIDVVTEFDSCIKCRQQSYFKKYIPSYKMDEIKRILEDMGYKIVKVKGANQKV